MTHDEKDPKFPQP